MVRDYKNKVILSLWNIQTHVSWFGLVWCVSSVLGSLETLAPTVSIETELAMEQMKEKYEREVQDLKIQLETKVQT